ncbi:MAG: STAS-like domain-containing protein [Alphaproteobacteria bacterium]|nr:STAS-like domain-containing protein [Alphaproteobacteria bacterium]
MRDVVGTEVLAGALTGRKALGSLLERIGGEPAQPEPVYLDFSGIEVATASFLRECILEFRDIVRKRWTNYYPVVANANESIAEELSVLLSPQRDVLMLCTLNEDGVPGSPRLLGELEPKQRIAFDLVNKLGEADAGELMRTANGSEEVGQTAWNNRLASLSRLGLLMEMSLGRAKRYRPLPLEE